MADCSYKAASILLSSFVEEASSTCDFLRFVRENFEYLKGNIEKENQFRKKETNLFKHRTLLTLRQSLDDFFKTISRLCLDPIIQGVEHAQIELRDIVNKLNKIHSESSELINSAQNHLASYLDKLSKANQETEASITALRRIKQTEFTDFKEIMTLNGKGVPKQHYLQVQTQKEHLVHKILMNQREEGLCREIIGKIEQQLQSDYKYASETLSEQLRDTQIRVCRLQERLADKCRQDIYEKLHFSGIFNFVVPEQNGRQIDKLEQFLRMEDETPQNLENLEHRMSESIENQDFFQKDRLIAVGINYKENLKTVKEPPSEVCLSMRQSSQSVQSVEYNIALPKDIEEGSPAIRSQLRQEHPFNEQLQERQSNQPNSAFKPDQLQNSVNAPVSEHELEQPQQPEMFGDIPKILNCDMEESVPPAVVEEVRRRKNRNRKN